MTPQLHMTAMKVDMPDKEAGAKRVVTVGLIPPSVVASFGSALRRAMPLDHDRSFDDLLTAIDKADLQPR